jgi:hypothetical protein
MRLAKGYLVTMPRLARLLVPVLPHHVTQRGNSRAAIFLADSGYEAYLAFLERLAGEPGRRMQPLPCGRPAKPQPQRQVEQQ